MDNVLKSILELLEVMDGDTSFDNKVAMLIDDTFPRLYLLGVDIPKGLSISKDPDITWEQLLGSPDEDYHAGVRTWIYCDVRLIIDPPTNSFLVNIIRSRMDRIGFDISVLRGG